MHDGKSFVIRVEFKSSHAPDLHVKLPLRKPIEEPRLSTAHTSTHAAWSDRPRWRTKLTQSSSLEVARAEIVAVVAAICYKWLRLIS